VGVCLCGCVCVCVKVVHAMKAYGGMEVELHSFLTMALHEVEWSASCLGCLTPREILFVLHCLRGSVDHRTSLGVQRKVDHLAVSGSKVF